MLVRIVITNPVQVSTNNEQHHCVTTVFAATFKAILPHPTPPATTNLEHLHLTTSDSRMSHSGAQISTNVPSQLGLCTSYSMW